jgi:CRISPR-associated endonuclease/helicase Cas3
MRSSDFPEFFDAVWRERGERDPYPPFPWQSRLAEQVVDTGVWPDLLDLPTGSGKTAVVDVAIFALACRPDHFPRRTVYVVDRRIVVDQVARRVERLTQRLAESRNTGTILEEAAVRLQGLFGGDPQARPIHLAELRGGIAMDSSWSLRPDVPAVLVSTVDQVGSRLLHRGYGVSNSMLPVHAGLIGNDCLYVLDEVHLSQPFAQTLEAVRSGRDGRGGLPDRFQIVQLSATPASQARTVFKLGPDDWDDTTSPVLARRLATKKRVYLKEAGNQRERAEEALPPVMAELARRHTGTVAVITNRVATARQTAELLDQGDDEVLLVTGRMRPFERDGLIARFAERLRTGRDRSGVQPRLFLVGTQSLEVGADFDVDALVTECASWDALRQRFGRVDRDGLLCAGGEPAEITVVKARSSGFDDPVYGPALAKTWEFLQGLGDGFEVGTVTDLQAPKEALPAPKMAPLLLRSHWRSWVQTRPRPHVEPDPSLWLHGRQPSALDVDLVWREDLSPRIIAECGQDETLRLQVQTMLRHLPPLPGEAMPVPVGAARAWLAETDREEVAVADSEGSESLDASVVPADGRPALRVRAGKIEPVYARQIRPGDTLLVPCSYGGVIRANWAPLVKEPVVDIARDVRVAAGYDDVVRLLPSLGDPPVPNPMLPLAEQWPEVSDWVETHLGRKPLRSQTVIIDYSPAANPFFVVRFPAATPSRAALDATAGIDQDGSDERNSFVGNDVNLHSHCEDVGQLAALFARRLGLPKTLECDLELAGRLHDLGKADPRFQRWLTGGLGADEPLAKSRLRDPRQVARARLDSGYPQGGRHELMSLALIESDSSVLANAADPDLVRHLVASHHGWCRPWAPSVPDPDPTLVEITHDGRQLRSTSDHSFADASSGIADRFFALVDRYGWHGLAWLECILRLADHRRSQLDEEMVS